MVDYKKLFFILLKEFSKQNNINKTLYDSLKNELFYDFQNSSATPEEVAMFMRAVKD